MADLSFPDYGVPFPYQNLLQQLAASMQNPTPGSYGRWGGTGLMAGAPGASGGTGSQPPATPLPGAVAGPGGTYPMPIAPPFIGNNRVPSGPPTAVAPPGPPLTGITSVPPAGFNPSAPPPPGANVPPGTTPPPTAGIPVNGSPMVKPLSNLKIAGGPQVDAAQSGGNPGLLSGNFQSVLAQNPVAAFDLMVKNNPGLLSQLTQAGYSPSTINSYGAGGGSNYHPNSMLPGLNGGQSSYGVVLGQGGIPAGESQQKHMQDLMTWRNQVQMAAMRGDNARYQQLLGSAPSGAQVINMGGPTGPMTTGRRNG